MRRRSSIPCTRDRDEIVSVDLEGQTISCAGKTYPFSIDPVRRTRLLNGWDDIAMTMSFQDQIAAFKPADRTAPALGHPKQSECPLPASPTS